VHGVHLAGPSDRRVDDPGKSGAPCMTRWPLKAASRPDLARRLGPSRRLATLTGTSAPFRTVE
jgi:hypothetical protein